jgi:cyclopropane fatty-acyl-phospholipid synthase-like methyltransferase
MTDHSSGYDGVARQFIEHRRVSDVGASTIRTWARLLPSGAEVLDLGCGSGLPISRVLIDEGIAVFGVDASPALCADFRRNVPEARVACEPVEESEFYGRRFDGVVAWGLVFLLPAKTQLQLMDRVARALASSGRFIFTAPTQLCSWTDVMTGRVSQSIGDDAYRAAFAESGLSLSAEYTDEGENHYYEVTKL